jgi:hypothetical protein
VVIYGAWAFIQLIMGHKERLMQYLLDNEGITQRQATEELGNTRLAATVHILRAEGIDIVSIDKIVPTRWKTKKGETKSTKVTFYKLAIDDNTKTRNNSLIARLKSKVPNLFKKN